MVLIHWKPWKRILKQFSFLRWHCSLALLVLFITFFISYRLPFALLFNLKHLVFEYNADNSVRERIIIEQKQAQHVAVEWLKNLVKNPGNYPDLISNSTHQFRSYDYLESSSNHLSSYTLLDQSKRFISKSTTDHIVISILYSKQNSDYRQGKFYLGQVLYKLLKNSQSRFLITLCENENTDENTSDGIELLRSLLPVFVINTQMKTNLNPYEREKQAHLQCILANFQSFSNVNYLLLLQDDAEPISDQFSSQLSSLIDSRIKHQWPLNGHRKQPAFIKLYHPRWLIGYMNPSIYILTQLITTSFLISFGIYFIFVRKSTLTQRQYSFNMSFNNYQYLLNILLFLFYFLLILVILLLLDHTNVSWTWRSLHPSFYAIYPAPSCCIPGVLFFRETHMNIIDYLSNIDCHKKYAIDTAFDDLPRRTGLQTYLLEPNLLHHIGLFSRLRQNYINPDLLD